MKTTLITGVLLSLFLILTACTPSPVPAPTTQAPTQAPIAAPKATTVVSAEDAAWAKLVEAAKKEGKLTVYSFNLVGDVGIAVNKAFDDKYGITMNIITGRGAEFVERLKTEKRMGKLMADVSEGSSVNILSMKKEGLTTSLGGLPVLQEKDVWMADILAMDPKDKHTPAFSFGTYASILNTNLVKPGEEPKVWADFLDPKWKGRMLITDPSVGAATYQAITPLLRAKVIDVEFLNALYKQELRFTLSQRDSAAMLARGEGSISIDNTSTVYTRFIAEGSPIRAFALSDGTTFTSVTMAAFEGAPHPNAAKLFANWFLSPEGQTAYCKAASQISVRKDVPNFLPKGAQVTPPHPVVTTDLDNEEATRLFQDRWLNKLWKK